MFIVKSGRKLYSTLCCTKPVHTEKSQKELTTSFFDTHTLVQLNFIAELTHFIASSASFSFGS